jgi:hypothetical protein
VTVRDVFFALMTLTTVASEVWFETIVVGGVSPIGSRLKVLAV